MNWAFLYFLPLAWLWVRLIEELRVQWSANPQYAYGYAVPFLCLYLIWRKAETANAEELKAKSDNRLRTTDYELGTEAKSDNRLRTTDHEFRTKAKGEKQFQMFGLGLLAFLYLPTRLIQEANPGWALATWPLAILVISLTFLFLRSCATRDGWVRGLAFPLWFFLIAVPWPFTIEQPVIQGLTRLNTALTVEILGILGIPAVPQGNVIELATGTVGIDEACSGIRSLQATLMIGLFLGELHRLSTGRRVVCVAGGFALAMVCNLARMLLLCWVAAHRGVDAIAGWHDPAGVTILVACFVGVWGMAAGLGQRTDSLKSNVESLKFGGEVQGSKSEVQSPGAEVRSPEAEVQSPKSRVQSPDSLKSKVEALVSFSAVRRFSILLGLWVIGVELGVAGWYHYVEARLPAQGTWQVNWPETNAVCRELPIAHKATEMLHYDEARQVQWVEPGGSRWQLSWFYWKPGKAAGYLAKSHNPLICMPAAGFKVAGISAVEFVAVAGLKIPVRIYRFEEGSNAIYVLYSRWEDKAVEQSFATESVSPLNRLRSVWNGRGNHGERVVSLALWSNEAPEIARERLIREFGEKVKAKSEK